jgi:peptidoglycan hydrolase CwlO-like protein
MTSIKITYPEELLAQRVKELDQSLTTCLTQLTRAWDDISSLQQEVLDLRAKIMRHAQGAGGT